MKQEKREYQNCICPICEHKITGGIPHQCPICGWTLDEQSQEGIEMREYWRSFISILEKQPDYRYVDNPEPMDSEKLRLAKGKSKPVPTYEKPCPVCGEKMIHDEYDICPVCGWLLDPIQSEDPDCEAGANRSTINQAKEAFRLLREKDPGYRWDKNPENLARKLKEITGQLD